MVRRIPGCRNRWSGGYRGVDCRDRWSGGYQGVGIGGQEDTGEVGIGGQEDTGV